MLSKGSGSKPLREDGALTWPQLAFGDDFAVLPRPDRLSWDYAGIRGGKPYRTPVRGFFALGPSRGGGEARYPVSLRH